ncbi:hypothetical protein C808_05328 [Lachnospiraceae bacterium M18-1]|nr:hypothetical protein C808_05328 [Lachnospiraceae bacterium M18-1]
MNQNKHIDYFHGYLSKKDLNVVDLIGAITVLIITKDIFTKNSEVKEFIKCVLNVNFPEYVVKSRTLMAARVGRLLIELDAGQILRIAENVIEYLGKVSIEKNQDKELKPKRNKKKNENEKLEKWLKGL